MSIKSNLMKLIPPGLVADRCAVRRGSECTAVRQTRHVPNAVSSPAKCTVPTSAL